ncbi:short-chain dehydrogenase, partial [Rhodococcus hoagii]|nr:short-chain dehydrogenase [Prescottella equi]
PAGLNMDIDGLHVSEPVDVAAQAIANIGNGPVFVTKGNEEKAERRGGGDRVRILLDAHDEALQMLPPETV